MGIFSRLWGRDLDWDFAHLIFDAGYQISDIRWALSIASCPTGVRAIAGDHSVLNDRLVDCCAGSRAIADVPTIGTADTFRYRHGFRRAETRGLG